MTKTCVALREIQDAVHLACRAPSYHNSQPWNWLLESGVLRLFVDPDHQVYTDNSGRQTLLSCGAVLDHLRAIMAADGWDTHVERFPNPVNHNHVANIEFTPAVGVTPAQRRYPAAILSRHADRLPFGPVEDWPAFETVMRVALGDRAAYVDVLAPEQRAELVQASDLAETLRLYDSAYHDELNWWTAPFGATTGIPHSALVSAQESDRVDIGRLFPVTHTRERRTQLGDDQSTVLVISAVGDTPEDILVCGEALSAVLLEATMAGLASCVLTHMTEHAATGSMISTLTGRESPQVLVRIGRVPALDPLPPPTPRRPLSDVFHYRMRVER